jgi:phospholipid/cholesterol/gamma-HCH transport system substrate-binding protein
MPRETGLEVKVGMFVVLAIVCLVAFVFSISDFSVFKKGVSYRVVFSYANGLKKGAPVRVAGVDAGHIRQIRVMYDAATRATSVLADVWMQEGYVIPSDSKFLINQLGLLGEKYLEVMPGASAQVMSADLVARGEDSVPMETITRTIGAVGEKVGVVLDSINNGILTEANKVALALTLANVASVTQGIKDGQGTVGKFLTDPALFNNLDEMSADLKANPWKLLYRPKGK